jgi:chaperonin GroES
MQKSINYKPRGDRVIVKQLEATEQAPGGMELPDSQQKPPNEGIVIAAGPGLRNRVTGYVDEIDLKPGDHVVFVEHAGYEIVIDGETYLQMRDEEIVGTRVVPVLQ